jgi:hypothetical protein
VPEARADKAASLDALLDSLLFEGYALYPYTPAATKNATPTPFGIVYPPSYAATLPSSFDHLELRCALLAPPDARISAEVRFLGATGHRYEAAPHCLQMPAMSLQALASQPRGTWSTLRTFGAQDSPHRKSKSGDRDAAEQSAAGEPLQVLCKLCTRRLGKCLHEVILRVENLTPCATGIYRAAALRRSLISTHPLLRTSAGRFVSPLEHFCGSVNTFPVLATQDDDAVLGAAIVLPDHPQIAPESRGGMFDSTEIEEALLLHVQTLSDGERDQIEREDPRVDEMIRRAAAVTPQQVLELHGRLTLRDPSAQQAQRDHVSTSPPRNRVSTSPPREPEGLLDPTRGEAEAVVDGVRFRRGGKVRLKPRDDADLHARMLDGRIATIERILVDYDGKTHFGVTIDDDPGQALLRETGRLLFFFAPEMEALDAR